MLGRPAGAPRGKTRIWGGCRAQRVGVTLKRRATRQLPCAPPVRAWGGGKGWRAGGGMGRGVCAGLPWERRAATRWTVEWYVAQGSPRKGWGWVG